MKSLTLAILSLLAFHSHALADRVPVINGFKLTDLRIELDAIKSGGPPRDGIPSINKPKFISPAKAGFMKDDDIVLSFTEGKVTRAYPLRVLVWHEIVNETIDGRPILVTYCPLCGTAMIFDRTVKGKVRNFGVSGLLYQSDVLMYDRESESLWSQLEMQAVSGTLSGTELEWLPSRQMTWKAWKAQHPDGEVLSTDTGHKRDYGANAYAAYFRSGDTLFPVPKTREDLPQKDWVVGVIANGEAMAFPVELLAKHRKAELRGSKGVVRVSYDPDSRLAIATGGDGKTMPTVTVFWFAWQAFNPETSVWKP